MSNPKTHRADEAVKHVMATLPDSLSARSALLKAFVPLVPEDYPLRDELIAQLVNCEHCENDQLKLNLLLNNTPAR